MQREELTWADIRSEILKNRQPEHWLMRRKPINLRLVGVLLGVLPRPTGLRGIVKSNFLDRVRQCFGCAGVLEGGQTMWRGPGGEKKTTRPRRCDVLSRHRYDTMKAYERMPGVPSISHLAFSFGDHDVLGSDS